MAQKQSMAEKKMEIESVLREYKKELSALKSEQDASLLREKIFDQIKQQ